ncbi:trypsin-like peptidase domain-containing protein [Streptomyces sp. NPDC058457]|uniref:trypsin-like peptidase domain-containing protein n=1 Tax=Streptomyces sp. NPDC058457 TaxID=3346507 RepID=UPI00364C6280
MDRRRLALVRGGEETGFRRIGSGYLIAPRLVLTARHVVEEDPGASWPRIDVRVGHPQDDTRRCAARVCWVHPDGGDVALLLLDDSVEAPGAVRWGRPVGNGPLPYDALGFPAATTRNGQYGVEHLRGELPVLGGGTGDQDRYVLDQGPAPEADSGNGDGDRDGDGGRAWSGASGSAVFCRDHLVGVVIHDDEAFGNRRLHACPARSFVDAPGFADVLERHGGGRPRLSQVGTDLERYLRAARLAATEHPYPGVVPGTMPPLSHIYVRQQVVSQPPPAEGRTGDTGLMTGSLLPASPPRPADEVLTGDGVCLVVGGPGGGKSSLLRTRLAHGATQWLDGTPGTGSAPVLVPAAALVGAPLSRALVDTVNAQLRQYGLTSPLPDTFFESRPAPGHGWLVLVDGLDEITSADGRKDVLRMVAHAGDDYAFIVATRPVPEIEPGDPGIIGPQIPRHELKPFGTDDLERVASGWFRALGVPEPDQTAGQFLGTLNMAGLIDLARVPLTMSMLCQLGADSRAPLPRGRGEIYQGFVNLLRERQYAAGAVTQARAAMRPYGSEAETRAEHTVQNLPHILAALAHRLLLAEDEDRPALDVTLDVTRDVALDIALDHEHAERPESVPEKRWRDFLESVLCGTGLLIRRPDGLAFTHQTFLEYFAARHVTDDEERLQVVFRETFFRRSQSRRRFSRDWTPPRYEPFGGFLLDLTPDDHPLKTEFLTLMSSGRAGLDGCRFLVEQAVLQARLPADVIENTANVLRQVARGHRSQTSFDRVQAATILIMIRFADGVELLRELAADPELDGPFRIGAAKTFAMFAPAESTRFLGDLVEETRRDSRPNDSAHRLKAVLALTEVDPAAATRELHALVRDGKVPRRDRLKAVIALNWFDDQPGRAELLRFLADDTTLTAGDRIAVAPLLADTDRDVAVDLYEKLARDPATKSADRLEAAYNLTVIDPQRGQKLLRVLLDDTTLGRRHRRKAARLLSGTADRKQT